MTINSYLTDLAKAAVIRDQEKENIKLSVSTLKKRLAEYFGNEVTDNYIFGSYDRRTILPRSMDSNSDVDYLIVFADRSYKPQTYLDRLLRFVEKSYPTSEIYQSNPTIVLSLNHINFELVPAVKIPLYGLQIPAKASAYQDWIGTNPTSINNELINANKSHNNLIKPLVRVVKFWNTQNGRPFDSYSLEMKIIENQFWVRWALGGQLKDYFFDFMESLDTELFAPKSQKETVARAKKILDEVKNFETAYNFTQAEDELKKLFLDL